MDAERLLGQLLMGGLASGGLRRSHGMRGLGGLGGGFGRSPLSGPGLLLLGGLAVAAYEHYTGTKQAAASPLPPATEPPPLPPEAMAHAPQQPPAPAGEPASSAASTALLLVDAMIEAAKADGTIDPQERTRILDQLAKAGASEDDRGWLLRRMDEPLDLDGLVARAGRDPVLAGQVYAASLCAIDADTPAERGYLEMLAARLGLDETMIADIARRVADLRASPQ